MILNNTLFETANRVHEKSFGKEIAFERAIFFSWGCSIGDCTFCYMSTQPYGKNPQETRRTTESILAEFIFAKNVGWDIGFFTGGIGAFTPEEIEFFLKAAYEITGEKLWLSVGPIAKPLLKKYSPYIRGVVGSTETINPDLHKKVCPSKPLAPYEKMFREAKEFDLECAMTFIVGMGEKKEDIELLKDFIQEYAITKIHIYGLIPQKGTMFENVAIPTAEEQAWWIAQLRIAFPTLDIQCGIWEDRTARVALLLSVGANSISKFQATKLFGLKQAQDIETQVKIAGRIMRGSLTKLPQIDWEKEVEKLSFDEDLKKKIKEKLQKDYLKRINHNLKKVSVLSI
ncbi:MAG TPA: radical SAM protein [Nanoarchaeota archaeon]|nr:radical SAM protein [Nanoarchaeota archaeon]HIH59115.1 radical SAM protein [Nanoarchaeota archaeon]